MKYQTAISDVEFFAFHGLYPEEKLTGGKFRVTIVVECEADDQASFATVHEVVNYEMLYAIAKREMGQPRELIETVAKTMLDEIGRQFTSLNHALIRITKLDPGGAFRSGNASVALSKNFR